MGACRETSGRSYGQLVEQRTQGRAKITNTTCAGNELPAMFGKMGHTARTDVFFFRDISGFEPDVFGLHPNGWRLYFDDCTNAANYNDQQGMLFVR